MTNRTAIIIGAGPAGLTAAVELLARTDITPIVYEATDDIGGIARTVDYKGNYMDIGGHRFFSRSQRVMQWWLRFFPLQGAPAQDDLLLGREVPLATGPNAPDPEVSDRVMLIRPRVSRIFFERTFYDYPISLSWNTVSNLGARRLVNRAELLERMSAADPQGRVSGGFPYQSLRQRALLDFLSGLHGKGLGDPLSPDQSGMG